MHARPPRKFAAVFVSFAGLLTLGIGAPWMAFAMHETDHRFTVSGYVYDKQGKPVKDARVHVRDLRDQKVEGVTTYTDGAGYYKAVLHLHNDNAGDPVQVTAVQEKLGLEEAKTVRATYSATDLTTERQATVHIGPVPEGGPRKADSFRQYIIVGTGIAAALAAMVWWRLRKTRNRVRRRGKKRSKA
jgi:cytochrome oxidase assembly protein ShyY1